MVFIFLLGISALSIAAVAAYFSIYGLAAIFSGFFWQVIAMGTVLELGKLVTASYVYRYGSTITMRAKAYYVSAVIILMLITSAGIFGFLSQGYQQDTLSLKIQEQNILLLVDEKKELEKFKIERLDRRKQIDNDIASLPNNYITARQRLLKSFGPELDTLKIDIAEYTTSIKDKTLQISKIKQEKLINEVHIGPIIFIARAFESDTDTATKWLIIMLIFAFDPLAVMLTIATNNAMMIRAGTKPTTPLAPPKPPKSQKKTKTNQLNIKDEPLFDEGDSNDRMIQSIKDALSKYSNKTLTAEDLMHQQMLEEMLKRKMVTAKLRGETEID